MRAAGLGRAGSLPLLLLLLAVLLLLFREAGTCSAASRELQLPQCMTERGAATRVYGGLSLRRGSGLSCRARGSVSSWARSASRTRRGSRGGRENVRRMECLCYGDRLGVFSMKERLQSGLPVPKGHSLQERCWKGPERPSSPTSLQ